MLLTSMLVALLAAVICASTPRQELSLVDVLRVPADTDAHASWTIKYRLTSNITETLSKRDLYLDRTWYKAVCSGQKIFQALSTDSGTAGRFIAPVTSSWDGAMVEEMKTWGYNDNSGLYDSQCDFKYEFLHNLGVAFQAMGIDPKSAGQGGPNQCFSIEHQNGPTIPRRPDGRLPPNSQQYYTAPDGLQYRVTGGHAIMGVNPISGVMYFINHASPGHAAKRVWNRYHDPPRPNELPLLRTSSDFAWAFWNRASIANIKNIQKIMSVDIVNDDTLAIIKRALQRWEPPQGQPRIDTPQLWPGTTFILTGDSEGLALLGSPNGLGAGYFLAQHKAQLGGNKVISKITVWVPVIGDSPTLLFWVADELEPEEPADVKDGSIGRIAQDIMVNSSSDGKDAIREYVFRARL